MRLNLIFIQQDLPSNGVGPTAHIAAECQALDMQFLRERERERLARESPN